ncbi:AsmA family protein [Noviherbaspirillum sp.]|jgi:AsmA protein|uniref:AsmA family protein n=1 Tax=Noviherbaspirillum sp. TaxID=1926288 RepID=UPI0025EBB871|nr:AsmA family protein [Noviherbaspirillum sp.]
MRKTARIILIALAALIALLLAAAGIIAATFNPNDYKPLLIRLVQEKKQRTLSIPGDIKLTFFPKLGADLGRVSISEHNSNTEFAAVDSAKVSLALIPLLAKQLVVDRVRIDGLRTHITRFKDGSANYDDLLSKDESGQQVKFAIDSVHISHANVIYDDRQQGRKFELANMDLETGKIANNVPSKLDFAADVKGNKPEVNARVNFKTGFTLDLEGKRYTLKNLDAQLKGGLLGFKDLLLRAAGDADLQPEAKRFLLDGVKLSANGKQAGNAIDASVDIPKLAVTDAKVSGGKLSGQAKLSEGGRTISADFSMPSFEGTPQAFKLPALTLDAAIKDATLDAKANISGALAGDLDKLLFTSPQLALRLSGRQGDTALNGSLTTPLSADLKNQLIELSRIAADFTLPNPGGGTLALKAGGNASVHLGKQTASAVLKGSLDQSNFNAKLGLSDFSPAAYTFDIGIDQLDLDRYKRKAAVAANAPASKPVAEEPMDFSALQKLQASGSVRVGALKVANLKTSNVRFDVHVSGGKLDLSPLAANLYGGSVSGALAITAGKPVRFALRQTLSGINVGPLLKDAIDKEPIEGRGNVQLDVSTSGATFNQIKKGLNGNAKLELRDGAIRGVNIAQTVRRAKAQIGAIRGDAPPQSGTASAAEKTDFSELTGSFRIANGVAHNDDLNIKSPLVRVGGSGDINLGEDRIDYLARATVVSTLQGQGGPELQALKGLTLPVKLSGPFSAIGWRIDFAGMASELAKQKIDEKKEEVKAKIQEQLKDKLKGFLGR